MNPEWLSIAGVEIVPGDRRFALLRELWEAQKNSVWENSNNASNETIRQASAASLSLSNTLAAAMLTTGGHHAPVIQARRIVFRTQPRYEDGVIVPGFGNSFWKDRVDPVWLQVLDMILSGFPEETKKINDWSDVLRAAGKSFHPNAACMTAAVAEIVMWPEGLEPLLVIEPRIAEWAQLYRSCLPTKRMMQ